MASINAIDLAVTKYPETKLPYERSNTIELNYSDSDDVQKTYIDGIDSARRYLSSNRSDKSMFFREVLFANAKNGVMITEVNCKSGYVVGVDYYENNALNQALRVVDDAFFTRKRSNAERNFSENISGANFTFLKVRYTNYSYIDDKIVKFEPPSVKPGLKNYFGRNKFMDVIHNQAVTISEAFRNENVKNYIVQNFFGPKNDNTGTVGLNNDLTNQVKDYYNMSQAGRAEIRVKHVS